MTVRMASPRRSQQMTKGRQRRPRAKAYEYSDAYRVRLKIHKIASFATIPLFVTEMILGQKLYNFSGSDGVRSAHQAIATSLAVLFGANPVTGVWNLVEGRHDPNRKTKVLVHGIMMLGADAGFTAAGLMAPSRHDLETIRIGLRRIVRSPSPRWPSRPRRT